MPSSIRHLTDTILDKLIPSAKLRRHPITTLSCVAAVLALVVTWLFYAFPGSSSIFRPLLAGIVTSNTSLIILEPEKGVITSPMTTGTDTAASGNKYVFTTVTNTTQANTSALASSNSNRVLAAVAAPTGGGINVEPSMRPWRYVGANPDSWWCVPPNCSQNPDPTVSINTELSLSHQLGVRLLRLEFPWFLIEPQKGTFDWTRSDYIVNTAKQMGVEIEPILVFSPSWAATGPNNGPKSTDYASFTTAIVNRYKSSIHVWELWNEPNLGQYCSCNYMSSILIPGSNAVRAADPTALVAIGAPAGADTNWISGIYNNGGAQYFDIMGFHDYVGGGQVLSDANLVYNVMSAHGDANKPLWLGEYGFQESGVQDNQQQGLMTVVLNAIKNKTTHITMAEWYNLRDDDPMDCCPPSVIKHETYGIVLHDDTTKKIGFTTMQNLLASFGGTTPPPPPSPNPPPPAPSPPPLPTNTGQAALTLNAPSTGTYYVWTRMKAADVNSDSYWLQIDNQAGIRVGDGGVPFGSWTWVNWQNGTTSSKISVSLTQGNHTLQVIGREANTQIDTVVLSPDPAFDPNNPAIVDSLPPVVTVNSPTNNATLSGTTSVQVQATDDHAVAKVDLMLDNSLVSSQTTGSANVYTFSLDTTQFTPGSHSLLAKATDIAGNVGSSSILSVSISQPTPTPPPPPPPAPSPSPSPSPSPTPPPGPPPCPIQPVPVGGCPTNPVGDLNGDGKVNILDFSVLLRNWNALGGPADLNHDGIVNIFDLSILLSNWGH